MKKAAERDKTKNTVVAISISIIVLMSIVVLMFTVPITENSQNVIVDITVHQPLIGEPEIQSATATSQPVTLLSFGSVFDFISDVTKGDNFVITASAGGKTATEDVPGLTYTTEYTTTLKIKDIRATETTVLIELVGGDKIFDSIVVTIE